MCGERMEVGQRFFTSSQQDGVERQARLAIIEWQPCQPFRIELFAYRCAVRLERSVEFCCRELFGLHNGVSLQRKGLNDW